MLKNWNRISMVQKLFLIASVYTILLHAYSIIFGNFNYSSLSFVGIFHSVPLIFSVNDPLGTNLQINLASFLVLLVWYSFLGLLSCLVYLKIFKKLSINDKISMLLSTLMILAFAAFFNLWITRSIIGSIGT